MVRDHFCGADHFYGAACVCRYFLRKLRKVKKANGQILACNEVRGHIMLGMLPAVVSAATTAAACGAAAAWWV